MNSAESSEEPSSSAREDGASDSERPHKKARFAWQIKGKYHLKNSSKEANASHSTETVEPEPPPVTEEAPSETIVQPAVVSIPEVPSTEPGPSRTEAQPASYETHDPAVSSDPVHVRSRRRHSPERDQMDPKQHANCGIFDSLWEYENAEWKEEQLEKCINENAINHFLEKTRDPFVDMNERITEGIQELQGVNNVVDRAILMAISSHGLQHAVSELLSTDGILELEDSDSSDSQMSNDLEQVMEETKPIKSRESSPIPTNTQSTIPPDEKVSADEINNIDTEPDILIPYLPPPEDNDADFINTAVLHAIQSKGLVTWTGFG